MDIELDELEREKENMILNIEGLEIEVPEELIQERMDLMGITREDVTEMLKKDAEEYKRCLEFNKKYNKNTFESRFISYLDGEFAMYRQ